MTDYTQSSRQRLIQHCLDQNPGFSLGANNIVLSAPEHNRQTEKNTRVTVYFVDTQFSMPTQVLHYDRLDIGTFFQLQFGADLFLDAAGMVSNTEAIGKVLEQYGVAIDADEIVEQPIVANRVSFRIRSTSYGWHGSVSFSIGVSDFTLDDGDVFVLDDGQPFELD